MPSVSRTIGPLHFEDLEPHRFEDLVRQLAYGFRRWRLIEPTGRLGADEGIDIRAIELVRDPEETPDTAEADEEGDTLSETIDREWAIQCKREKAIGPARIPGIVEAALRDRPVHGFILAAACDFSRKAREVFRRESAALGAQEAYLWGKGDLEDMLFRPENDHLLFAYFGVSLVVRRRSVRMTVRSVLSTKRRAVRALGEVNSANFGEVFLRDAEDTSYPGRSQNRKPGRWRVCTFRGYEPEGLRIESGRYAAFLADDREQWDAAFALTEYVERREPWLLPDVKKARRSEWERFFELWNGFPESNRAWLVLERILRYERIVDIDKDGDRLLPRIPHIFVELSLPDVWLPFSFRRIEPVRNPNARIRCIDEKRIVMFPPEYRDPPPDSRPAPRPNEKPA